MRFLSCPLLDHTYNNAATHVLFIFVFINMAAFGCVGPIGQAQFILSFITFHVDTSWCGHVVTVVSHEMEEKRK